MVTINFSACVTVGNKLGTKDTFDGTSNILMSYVQPSINFQNDLIKHCKLDIVAMFE